MRVETASLAYSWAGGCGSAGPVRVGSVPHGARRPTKGTSGHDEDEQGQVTAPSWSVPRPPASSRGRFESYLLRREDPCSLPCRRPRPRCVRLGLELAVDPEVGPLVVEADQVLNLGTLGDRERITPGNVLLECVADPGRPVAGPALVGALSLAVGRRQ